MSVKPIELRINLNNATKLDRITKGLVLVLILSCSLIQGFQGEGFPWRHLMFFVTLFLVYCLWFSKKLLCGLRFEHKLSIEEWGIVVFGLFTLVGYIQAFLYIEPGPDAWILGFDPYKGFKANTRYLVFFLYPVVYELFNTRRDVNAILTCIVVAAIALNIQALMHWLSMRSFFSQATEATFRGYRLQSAELTDNYFMYGLAVALGYLFFQGKDRFSILRAVFMLLLFIFFTVRVIGSVSKLKISLWLVTFLASVLMGNCGKLRYHFATLAVLVLISVVSFVGYPQVRKMVSIGIAYAKFRFEHAESSWERRPAEYKAALREIMKNPVFGHGPAYKYYYYRPGTGFECYSHVHNFFLRYALNYGLIAASLLILFIVKILSNGLKFLVLGLKDPIFISSFLMFFYVVAVASLQTILVRNEDILIFILSAALVMKSTRREITE